MKALLFYRWGLIDSKLLSSFELYLKLAAAAAGYNKQQTLKWKKRHSNPFFFDEPLFPPPEESFKKQTYISGLKKSNRCSFIISPNAQSNKIQRQLILVALNMRLSLTVAGPPARVASADFIKRKTSNGLKFFWSAGCNELWALSSGQSWE